MSDLEITKNQHTKILYCLQNLIYNIFIIEVLILHDYINGWEKKKGSHVVLPLTCHQHNIHVESS